MQVQIQLNVKNGNKDRMRKLITIHSTGVTNLKGGQTLITAYCTTIKITKRFRKKSVKNKIVLRSHYSFTKHTAWLDNSHAQ